jgi:radical SAM superfamily enzyme YgiQ (UPF0313 family)
MSDYSDNPFVAFVAGFAKGPVPLFFLRKALYPPVKRDISGRARLAPYGLRKVEALLLENGFDESEVAVVHPADLEACVGKSTKVVGISTMDPTGMGYVSETYSSLVGGGEPLNALEFKALVNHRSIRKYEPKLIVGGFGAWQLERRKAAEYNQVDCVLIGGETHTIVETFHKAANGDLLPHVVHAPVGGKEHWLPTIRHAAIHGAVEISRGCGRNCQFCTPTMQKKVDVPMETILREVAITVNEGSPNVTLVTEDLFLYSADNTQFLPNKDAVVNLVKRIAEHPGVRRIQPSHTSLAPVVADPNMVREVAEILIERHWYSHGGKPIVTSETGVETGSTRLMEKYMARKMLPFKPEMWKDIVVQGFGILNDCSWYPLATLIVGLPEEKEGDVAETLEMLDDLKDYNAFYVPLFFVPLENCLLMHQKGAKLDSLTEARWELLSRCWEYNARIWGHTFLRNRLGHPILFKAVKNVFLPCAGKIASAYYGLKHGEGVKKVIQRMANA